MSGFGDKDAAVLLGDVIERVSECGEKCFTFAGDNAAERSDFYAKTFLAKGIVERFDWRQGRVDRHRAVGRGDAGVRPGGVELHAGQPEDI